MRKAFTSPRLRRLTAVASGVALLAGTMVLGVAAPASAGERAPDCVKAWQYSSGHVYVWNTCARDKRIKVVMAWGPDQACVTLRAGYDKLYIDPLGRFDRVELC